MISPQSHECSDRESRLDWLFEQVIDLQPEERDRFLEKECQESPEVADEVRRLVALEQDLPPEFLSSNWLTAPSSGRGAIPEAIGDYKILGLLGEGGMGVVYEALQESPSRKVALKVLRQDLCDASTVARFERESEILGQLQHPGIAHVYESGRTQVGESQYPYFAMEFVDGEPIDTHVRDQRLPLRRVLALMSLVADAVHHAHQKGIIHRDLKSENILVAADATSVRTADEAVGQPKVLDFGIARLTEQDVGVTSQTQVGHVIGTLKSMSPEQMAGDSTAIDTRSDVYSLGTILFELLAGEPPHDLKGVSLAECARIKREEAPKRLQHLVPSVPGDVATIVAKCLESEPHRRYASAAEFAMDLRRFLEDQPILARPATTLYQLKKFARRHRSLVIGLAAAVLALVVGLLGTGYGLFEANRLAREKAGEARRANEARDAMAKTLYAMQMTDGVRLLEVPGSAARIRERVEEGRRAPVPEVRGWEWFYLRSELGRAVAEITLPSVATSVAWASPDRWLTGHATGEVHGWQPGKKEPVWTLARPVGSPGSVEELRVQPGPAGADPRLVAVIWRSQRISLVRLTDGVVEKDLEAPVEGLAWHEDGTQFVVSSGLTLTRWSRDAVGGWFPGTSEAIPSYGTQMAWQPGGNRLTLTAAGGARGGGVYDLADRSFQPLSSPFAIRRMAWRPDGEQLAFLSLGGTGGVLNSADLTEAFPLTRTRGEHQVLGWCSDGTRLAISGVGGSVRMLDASGEQRALLHGHEGAVHGLAWHPGQHELLTVGADATLRQWQLPGLEFSVAPAIPGRAILSAAWSPDSTRFACAYLDGRIRVWDAETQQVVREFQNGSIHCHAMSWSPDGTLLAANAHPHVLNIWHVETGKKAHALRQENFVKACAWTPDGSRLVLLDQAGQLCLRAVGLGQRQLLTCFTVPVGVPHHVLALRPGHGQIVVAGNRELHLVDADTDRVVQTWKEVHEGAVNSLAFHPGGDRFASSSEDGTVRVWVIGSDLPEATLRGHTQWPTGVSWSPDGTRIASGGEDNDIRLWDARDGQRLAVLTGHQASLRRVIWSPDGQRLLSVDSAGRARVWDAARGYAQESVTPPSRIAVDPQPTHPLALQAQQIRSLELMGEQSAADAAREALLARLDPAQEASLERVRCEQAALDRWLPGTLHARRPDSVRYRPMEDHSFLMAAAFQAEPGTLSLDFRLADSLVHGVRLEALPDPRLGPGPGYGKDGRFEITGIRLFHVSGGRAEPLAAERVASDPGYPTPVGRVETAPSEDSGLVWQGGFHGDYLMVYLRLNEPEEIESGGFLRVELDFTAGHALSRLRLTTTHDGAHLDREIRRLSR